MQKRTFSTLVFLILGMGIVMAQLPQSNIYMFNMKQVSDSTFQFTQPKYLTHFNANGYNNQPVFFNAKDLYITVQEPNSNQSDIYLLDLDQGTKVKVTDTKASEFSPQRMPSYFNFSTIRQEVNGSDTILRLWQFPIDRLTNGKPVFKYITNIGYYRWLNGSKVAAFIVDQPNYLAFVSTQTDEIEQIANNPGRCFMKMPNGHLAYVQKNTFSDSWTIMEKNLYRPEKAATPIIHTLAGSEDFALLPDGTFIMGKGSKLYKFNRYSDEDWIEIADLSFYEINNISRIAVSVDYKIAVVGD